MSTNLPSHINQEFVSISGAAKILGVSIDTVRRWEKKGLISSKRLDGKNRYFSRKNLEYYRQSRPLSISEASDLLGVSTSTLRRYESRGILPVKRNGNQVRQFDRQVIQKLAERESTKEPIYLTKFAQVASPVKIATLSFAIVLIIFASISRPAESTQVLGIQDTAFSWVIGVRDFFANLFKFEITEKQEIASRELDEFETRIIERIITEQVITETTNIIDGSITNIKLATDAIDGTKIKNDSIRNEDIADGAINSGKIEDNTVTSSDIKLGSVVAEDLAALVFNNGQLVDLSAINHSNTSKQGLILPNVSNSTPSNPVSGEGFLAWDTSGNQVLVYNGSSWAQIGGTISLYTGSSDTSTTSSASGFELINTEEISLLRGCSDSQLLKWNDTTKTWGCASDVGAGGAGISTVEEGNVSVVTSATNIDFLSADFIVTNAGSGEADVAIDYTNSKIVRSDQNETITGSWTITSTDLSCTNCIGATEISDLTLGADTAGDYVASISSGNGISASASGEGSTPSIALSNLTSDWNQTGAFDIILNNTDSQIQILENGATPTLFGILDIGDLSTSNSTFTFSGSSGTVLTTANYSGTIDSVYVNVGESPASAEISGSFSGGLTINTDSVDPTQINDSGVSLGASQDELCLTYENTGGAFEWQTCGSGGGSLDSAYNSATATIIVDAYDVTWQLNNATNDYNFVLDNTTSGAIATAFEITTSVASGTFATAIDISDADIGTALAIGSNDITTTSTTISATELDKLDNGIDLDELDDTGTFTATTVDINGGNIDGTTIGGTSAAAGTFTNLTVNQVATVGNGSGNDFLSFVEESSDPACVAGDFKVWANSSTNTIKKCQNGTITNLDTTGGTGTLQDAYTGGGSITTTDAKDIDFIFDDTATDSNLDIGVVADNTVSISRDATASTETPNQLLLLENLDADITLTNALLVQTNGGAITDGIEVTNTSGNLTNAININDTAGGTLDKAIVISGTITTAILDTPSIDISGSGAITGATGIGTTTITTTGTVDLSSDSDADTITIGQSGGTDDTVTIAGNVSITDDQWSISATGATTGLTGITADVDLTCTNCIGATEIDESTISSNGLSDTASIAYLNQSESVANDWTFTLAGSEDLAVTHDLAGTSNMMTLTGTPNASANTAYGIYVDQADSANANGFDAAIVIDNSDITGAAIGAAIKTIDAGGGFTSLFDINGTLISAAEFNILDDQIALGTETTGDYVSGATTNGGLAKTGTEGATLGISVQANKGLEVDANGLSLIDCGDTQILKYSTGTSSWSCQADAGGSGTLDAAYNSGTATITVDAYDILFDLNDGTNDYGLVIDNNTASAIAVGLEFTNAGGGGFTAGIDMGSFIITNVGNSGTDFTSSGGLTLADALGVTTGGVTISGTGALAVNSDSITSDGSLTIDANDNVVIGGSGNTFTFDESSGPLYAGTARPTRKVTLVPEFPGAVLTGDGTNNTGTMTTDYCSTVRNINENSTPSNTQPCDADLTEEHSYYSWATSQGTAQDYDIWITWQVPSDFSEFSSSTAINFYGWRTSSSSSVSLAVYDNDGDICNTQTSIGGTAGAWDPEAYSDPTGCDAAGGVEAGEEITFRVTLTANSSSDTAKIGEIDISYLSKF